MPRLVLEKPDPPHRAMKNHTLQASAFGAARGLLSALQSEKKVRQVAAALVGATLVCAAAGVGPFRILMVLFSWVAALICELFNTALEKALDYASGGHYHPLVRQAKDYASACTFAALLFAGGLSLFVLLEKWTG